MIFNRRSLLLLISAISKRSHPNKFKIFNSYGSIPLVVTWNWLGIIIEYDNQLPVCRHFSPCSPIALFPSKLHSTIMWFNPTLWHLFNWLRLSGGHTLRVRTSWCFIYMSVILTHNNRSLKMAASGRLNNTSNCCTGQHSPFNVPEFFVSTYLFRKNTSLFFFLWS